MLIETPFSDGFIDDYFDTEVAQLGSEFSESIFENGVPRELGFTPIEASDFYKIAQCVMEKIQDGDKVVLTDVQEILQVIDGPTIIAKFNPGMHLDFADTPLPENIPSDGHYLRNDYLYG